MTDRRQEATTSGKGSSPPTKLLKTGDKDAVAWVGTSSGVADCTSGRDMALMDQPDAVWKGSSAKGITAPEDDEEVLTVGAMRRMQGDMMQQIMQGMGSLMSGMKSMESNIGGMELRMEVELQTMKESIEENTANVQRAAGLASEANEGFRAIKAQIEGIKKEAIGKEEVKEMVQSMLKQQPGPQRPASRSGRDNATEVKGTSDSRTGMDAKTRRRIEVSGFKLDTKRAEIEKVLGELIDGVDGVEGKPYTLTSRAKRGYVNFESEDLKEDFLEKVRKGGKPCHAGVELRVGSNRGLFGADGFP